MSKNKKSYYFIFISVLLLSDTSFSQIICDDNICKNIIKNTNAVQKNPVVLKEQAIAKRNQLIKEGTIFDLNCDFPSFWYFKVLQNKKKKVIEKAKAIGVATRVDRASSCDINKTMLAVPIVINNEQHWAVTGFDGDPVFLDNGFITLITNPDLWCEGLPLDPTEYHICSICHQRYSSQLFRSKIGDIISDQLYYSPDTRGNCPLSSTKNHDNLVLVDNQGCAKSTGSNIIR